MRIRSNIYFFDNFSSKTWINKKLDGRLDCLLGENTLLIPERRSSSLQDRIFDATLVITHTSDYL